MVDLQRGIDIEVPVARFVPLISRGPAWLSFPLGTAIASSAVVGVPAALMALFGHFLPAVVLLVAGGYLFVSLNAALLLCTRPHRTGSNLIASLFAVGHTALFILLAVAQFLPSAQAYALRMAEHIPLLPLGPIADAGVGAAAPLYLLAFLVYSVLAPAALLVFRYLALRRGVEDSRRRIGIVAMAAKRD